MCLTDESVSVVIGMTVLDESQLAPIYTETVSSRTIYERYWLSDEAVLHCDVLSALFNKGT
jgi:hypothetical protein